MISGRVFTQAGFDGASFKDLAGCPYQLHLAGMVQIAIVS